MLYYDIPKEKISIGFLGGNFEQQIKWTEMFNW